jgi:hypothetical protein
MSKDTEILTLDMLPATIYAYAMTDILANDLHEWSGTHLNRAGFIIKAPSSSTLTAVVQKIVWPRLKFCE